MLVCTMPHGPSFVAGPNVKKGFVSYTPYMEQNALRTFLDLLGIQGGPGASSTAASMQDLFH